MEVTVKLLENAVDAALKEERPGEGWTDGKGRFLIDGFPRKMDQALKFDEEVQPQLVVGIGCTHILPTGVLVVKRDFLPNNRRSHAPTSAQTWRDQWSRR